ncbi:LCP family protein [Streptomyces sp. B1866]|uniref:LCP family protein n=1 Tax=Streptomyces sp. B1866 TaxID=3075431 RepID=UPI0028926B8D|nr:LCP family protein [Streptomyces sp. B1866]MDT3398249.1 LCP family protein [Streptomyces sp. B1866]
MGDGNNGAGSGAPGRVLRGTAWTLTVTVTVCVLAVGYLYHRLNGNLTGIDINGALGRDRPRNVDNGSLDILVLGSDSRAGDNGGYGGGDKNSARSDTAMVVHVYQGHRRATVVSIPRDTLVKRPACTATHGGHTARGAARAMFNTAYEIGGPACAVKTVEAMTGIRMDHYLEIDFSGFRKLVDKIGGVDITTTEAIHDKKSHLDLKAGRHHLDGKQALGLVRTRHGVGDGSDLGRIRLQQAFLKALLDRVRAVDLLGSPTKLYDLADTSTKALTTDSELASVGRLLGFARGLKGVDSDRTRMVTLPVRYDPANPNRVVPIDSRADEVWRALRADRQVPRTATKGSAGDGLGVTQVVRRS